MRTATLAGTALTVAALTTAATAQSFDFESQPTTWVGGFRTGSLTSLALTQGSLTVTITRSSGIGFDIVDNTFSGQQGKPAGWGSRSLDPFFDELANDAFVFTFSQPVTSFALQFGDYGGDEDTVSLAAFSGPSGGGANVANAGAPWGLGSFPDFGLATVSNAGGFSSVVVNGGTPGFPNSLFYDNLFVVVPAPATGLALLGLVAIRRRR